MIVAVMTTALAGTAAADTTYKLQQVTSVEAGGLYVFEQSGHVMNNTVSNNALQTTDSYNTTGLTGLESYVWTLEQSTTAGTYYMKNKSLTTSAYLYNSSSTSVAFGNGTGTNVTSWLFTFNENGVVLITINNSNGRYLGYANGTYTYKAYSQNSMSYAHAIKVYQLVEEGGDTPTPTTYTVTFNAGDGTFVGSTDLPNTSNTVEAGEYTLPSATREGYTFDGWLAGSSTEPVTGSYTVSGDVTFTAQYTENASPTGDLVIDFESATTAYSDWTFTNMESQQTTTITAHGGTYYGTTGGKATASIVTKAKIATPYTLTCYVSKQSTNSTSSTWYVQVSTDGSTWTDVANRSATDMNKGEWKEFTADLSSYSNVYVRVYYSGSTAIRNIDDLTLTTSAKPTIAATDVNIAYDVTSGAIEYTVSNEPTPAGVLTAVSSESWLTIGTIGTTVPFTCEANEVVTERTTTVTLTYTYGSERVTKDVVVTQAGNPNAPGTQNNPYTVAQARAAIDAGSGTQNVYATGIVSAIPTAWNSSYNNITFNFVDAEGDEAFLQAYRCESGTDVDASTVAVGDIVVVYGNLTKYGSTYEFGQGCTLVSLTHPVITTPTITVSSNSLSEFIYEEGNGPSNAKTITINGSNLTENLNLTLNANSAFEVSVNDNSDYSDHVYSNEDVLPRTIYVRLKSGLDVGEYTGTITLSSAGATSVNVSLSGSVTAPEAAHVTWDLSTNSYISATDDIVTWTSDYAEMTNTKGNSSTKPNNYLGGDSNNRTSTRMYTGNVLTITPVVGYAITSVVFEATTNGYASALKESTWTNATAEMEDGDNVKTVTVTPSIGIEAISATIGATCGFTSVKVYYVEDNTPVITANNVEINYDATSGNINYTIENEPNPAGTLTASVPSGSWLTLSAVTSTSVPFTCSKNLSDNSPEETVTLTYTYGDNETVTKDVIVTQRMPPAPESPRILVAENPFLFSTTATITCAAENVETIQYSTDGLEWQDYNGGTITITSSLTLYARAWRWGHVSEVTSY